MTSVSRVCWCAIVAVAVGCSAGGKDDDGGCEAGFHACGADCMPDASPLSCGTRCAPCPSPPDGDAICTAAGCGVECRAGYHLCGGACADDASVAACGAACAACPAPAHAHAHAACLAGSCGYACELGFLRCDTGCCVAPTAGSAAIALGEQDSCAIDAGGVLKCWGWNELGMLGSGSMSPELSTTPLPVAGLAAGEVVQVGAGYRHACAVDAEGKVRCWGGNAFGELGSASHQDSATPIAVDPISGALSAGAGFAHSCALLGNGTVRCWGSGEHGVLGDGHTYGGAVPGILTVRGLTGAYALAVGSQFNCALIGVASMACWGDNLYGQLGLATSTTVQAEPAPVAALEGVVALRAVALGVQHVCVAYDGASVSGAVRCWGRGDSGQLGNGAKPVAQVTPVEVPGLSGVVALAAGSSHTCAVTATGAATCWGAGADGQLGDGTWTERLAPTPVSGLASGVTAIAAGFRHTCALVDSGGGAGLRCWGWNFAGQLGDGTRTNRAAPVAVVEF